MESRTALAMSPNGAPTRIVIADPAVGAMKISGVFNAGDVVGFVGIVTHYLPVKAVSSDSSTIALESTAKKNRAL